jgi:uncharacterized repeat protein (TIGR01451 family)
MGRRLISLVLLALAVGFGVRIALAQAEAPALPPPAETLPVPEEVAPPPGVPPGAELPPPAVAPQGAVGEMLPAATQAEGAGRPATKKPVGQTPEGGQPLASPAAEPSQAKGLGTPAPKKATPPDGHGVTPPGPAKADPNPPPDPLDAGAANPLPPGGPALPSDMPAPAVDPDVERSQAPPVASPKGPKDSAADKNPLPAAKEPSGHSASIAPNEADELVLSPERLSKGVQSIGLTVEVKGPPSLNLKSPATYKIIVSNPGTTDAVGVAVYDRLPPELEFLSSQPAEQRAPDTILVWHLGTVRAGGRQEITLKVKPTRIGLFDHAVTVTMRAGAKTSTQVYEPKLKVVQIGTKAKVLKGQTVESRITVSNTGTGVAKDVIVQAKLSPGLRAGTSQESDQNLFELALGDLAPNQQVDLDPLVADAVLGGEQWCKVEVKSPDVVPGAEEAKSTQIVTVVEPKLAVTLVGPKERYTDTIATYTLTVENPGTATAQKVRVQAILPVSGRLVQMPPNAKFDTNTRRITWDTFQLDPGENEKVKLGFEVRMGGAGRYEVTAQAVGEQGLTARQMTATEVLAMADPELEITEDRRVVDVDQLTTFTIKVTNKGSKAATHLLISGRHSPELIVKKTAGTDEPVRYTQDPAGKTFNGDFVFPMIERLNPGQEVVLGVQVRALKPGVATCRVFLRHDDVEQAVEDMAALRVTPAFGH